MVVPKTGVSYAQVFHGERRVLRTTGATAPMQMEIAILTMTLSFVLRRAHYFAMAFAIVLITFSSAFATELRCSDLKSASADDLLATIDRRSVKYGGGVQVGKYDCNAPGQTGCDWETTLRDDRMLDRDHRLILVHSSHLTGSGFWYDLLVFGCVSGQVKKIYLGQFVSQEGTNPSTIFDSAPPALRPVLKEYMKHPGELPPP